MTTRGEVLSTRYHKQNKVKALKSSVNPRGYAAVSLQEGKEAKTYLVHRLVAEAFIPNPMGLSQVNHIDGNKQNNCVNNLEWVSPKENVVHAVKVLGIQYGHPKKVLCISTEEVFDRLADAAEKYKLDIGNLSRACRFGKKCGGLQWRYQ